jgi:hypothetical protein
VLPKDRDDLGVEAAAAALGIRCDASSKRLWKADRSRGHDRRPRSAGRLHHQTDTTLVKSRRISLGHRRTGQEDGFDALADGMTDVAYVPVLAER